MATPVLLSPTAPARLVMNFAQTVQRTASALEDSTIPYMFTGSFASTFYGAARSTIDLDVVIAPSTEQLDTLLGLLAKSNFYVDSPGAAEPSNVNPCLMPWTGPPA